MAAVRGSAYVSGVPKNTPGKNGFRSFRVHTKSDGYIEEENRDSLLAILILVDW